MSSLYDVDGSGEVEVETGVGDRCHSGSVKGRSSARIPTLTSKGAITRTVAGAKRARIVGKDG